MARTKKMMVRKSKGPKHFIMKAMQKRGTQGTGGVEETTPISPRHSGTEGNKEVPDVHGTPH